MSLFSDRYGLLDKRRKQLPPEIDDAAPVIKRQAVEYAENSPPIPATVKWNPYEATHGIIKSAEAPTLSDLFLRNGANAVATITGTGAHGKPSTNINDSNKDLSATTQSTWNPLNNFLKDYSSRNNGSDDTDSESKDES